MCILSIRQTYDKVLCIIMCNENIYTISVIHSMRNGETGNSKHISQAKLLEAIKQITSVKECALLLSIKKVIMFFLIIISTQD